ncbi:MAG TPA: DUF2510 domain-containing protein [Microlunatus sp.]|nr:DUF2510 domain-containing protein [Microlunatus sp.]
MSTPGWYPDPSGTPGRFRYWDGRAWTQQTSGHPSGRPPRRLPVIIGALALVVVIGLVVFFVLRQVGAGAQNFTDKQLPSSTVSGWDDSSPTARPTPTEPTPTADPTPSPSGTATARPLTSCPQGDPYARADHPADGRVHGGGLSFPRINGWRDDLQTSGVTWAYDVASQGTTVVPGWATLAVVGEIRRSDGFVELKQAAQSVIQCVASSQWYLTFDSAHDVKSEAATIDGHRAWWIRTDIRVTDREVEGDTVDVIVVDIGRPDSFGLFIGGVAIGNTDLLRILDETTRELKVD